MLTSLTHKVFYKSTGRELITFIIVFENAVWPIRFSAVKIIDQNAVKITVFLWQQYRNFHCWNWPSEPSAGLYWQWVIILIFKYHICVLLFIPFDLICNTSIGLCHEILEKLTHFSKIQIQILNKRADLRFLGSFIMLFLVLQANCFEKKSAWWKLFP